jgi:chromosome segregation ATPase
MNITELRKTLFTIDALMETVKIAIEYYDEKAEEAYQAFVEAELDESYTDAEVDELDEKWSELEGKLNKEKEKLEALEKAYENLTDFLGSIAVLKISFGVEIE